MFGGKTPALRIGRIGGSMSTKLIKAFKFTEEEHADAFERFANAFLVDDDPDLKALGGKKDKGMDAYVYDDASGKVSTVVQSCVSPASRARAKVRRGARQDDDAHAGERMSRAGLARRRNGPCPASTL